MSEKLLVADDSPTIQKVVGITLANTDYEIVQALSESELFGILESDSFDLVLLDFNLSEEIDGYELCKKVRDISPQSKLLVMLGTFDTVDDNRLEELGVVEKVIKPFESSKFIQKIKSALDLSLPETSIFDEDNGDEEYEEDESSNENQIFNEQSEEEWVISGPKVEEDDSSPMPEGNFLEDDKSQENILASEVLGWGMSVPEVIGSTKSLSSVMPPKMGEGGEATKVQENSSTISYQEEDATGEWKASELLEASDLPVEEDLDYPTMEDSTDSQPSSSLVSLDELSGNIGIDEDEDQFEELEETDPQIIIQKQEDDPDLEKELSGEISPDEFWAADEGYDEDQPGDEDEHTITIDAHEDEDDDFRLEKHSSIELGPKLEQDESNNPTVEALNDMRDREAGLEEVGPKLERVSTDSIDKDAIISSLKEELRPIIKEMVREAIEEMGRETSEKVAWEIIPDLAENLIRSEVEKLSQKVQEKHSLS
jgi:CheY-like chemotaxis protein